MALAQARSVPSPIVAAPGRRSFARIRDIHPVPNLIDIQRRSFRWFLEEGLQELFAEISPIQDFTGSEMPLLRRPSESECGFI